MRIVLVEDDDMIRECISEALGEAGMDTVSTATAEAAMEEMGRTGMPEVLVTDINLGAGMDGIALARLAHARSPTLRVVYISGRYGEVTDMDARDCFLRKPFRLQDLVGKVTEMLPPRASQAA